MIEGLRFVERRIEEPQVQGWPIIRTVKILQYHDGRHWFDVPMSETEQAKGSEG